MKSYIALMHRPEATSYWGVTFPDFPGCTSAGATFEEAFANAREALSGHVAAMRSDREAIPEPSQFDAALLNALFAEEIEGGAMPVFVDLVDVPAPKERINIMIDPGVLRRVDEAARAEGMSRSSWIEREVAARFVPTDHPIRKMPGGLNAAVEAASSARPKKNVGRTVEARVWVGPGKRLIDV